MAHSDAFDGFSLVSRYVDVVALLGDPDIYITSVRNVVPGSSTTGRRLPIHLDPPEHTPFRKTLERALSRSRIQTPEPSIKRQPAR